VQTFKSNLETRRLNEDSAQSRIVDADIARDIAEQTRISILQRSGAAILAQTNQQPAVALSLLQGGF
jgi:flagellin